MTLGGRIRAIRRNSGRNKTRAKFAVKIGISPTSLFNLETGLHIPKATLLQKLLELYPETSARWLLTGEGDQDLMPDLRQKVFLIVETYMQFPNRSQKLGVATSTIASDIADLFMKVALEPDLEMCLKIIDDSLLEYEKMRAPQEV